MRTVLKHTALILGLIGAITNSDSRAAEQQRGNDSADWCVVSQAGCTAKETSLSIQQGNNASFEARLTSPDRLNDKFTGFPANAYLAAGEWSSDCGLIACGDNPTVVITPSTLTFDGYTDTESFTVQVTAGVTVVPGEYRFKVKTFGPDNGQLNAIGWGFGSGITVTVLVSAPEVCTPPTLTIVAPTPGTALTFCAGALPVANGSTPVSVSLSATPNITGFSALVSRADDTSQQTVALTQTLSTDPATATGTGSAVGTIGAYKVVATATNACSTDTKSVAFDVNYAFEWLPPTPSTPRAGSNLATKFSIRDCADRFISDQTVEVTLTGPGVSQTKTYTGNPSTGVAISTADEQYHANFTLPAGDGVSYSIVVKFQGIQQGPARTFITKN